MSQIHKKGRMKRAIGVIGLGIASAMLATTPAPVISAQNAEQSSNQQNHHQNNEVRGITPKRTTSKYQVRNSIGGIPLESYSLGIPGLTPKEYGIRFGNGKSRKGKTNMLHVSRKAKMRG